MVGVVPEQLYATQPQLFDCLRTRKKHTMEFVRKQPKMEEVDCGSQLHLTNSVLNVIQWIDDCVAELIYWYASQLTKMIFRLFISVVLSLS